MLNWEPLMLAPSRERLKVLSYQFNMCCSLVVSDGKTL